MPLLLPDLEKIPMAVWSPYYSFVENRHKETKVAYIDFTPNERFSFISSYYIQMLDLPERCACVPVAENGRRHCWTKGADPCRRFYAA